MCHMGKANAKSVAWRKSRCESAASRGETLGRGAGWATQGVPEGSVRSERGVGRAGPTSSIRAVRSFGRNERSCFGIRRPGASCSDCAGEGSVTWRSHHALCQNGCGPTSALGILPRLWALLRAHPHTPKHMHEPAEGRPDKAMMREPRIPKLGASRQPADDRPPPRERRPPTSRAAPTR